MTQSTLRVPQIIRGAGAAGILIWHELRNQNPFRYPVLTDRGFWGGGATAHAQCVIHRGYSYNTAHPIVVNELSTSAAIWDDLIQKFELPCSRGVVYAFHNRNSLERAVSRNASYYRDGDRVFTTLSERPTAGAVQILSPLRPFDNLHKNAFSDAIVASVDCLNPDHFKNGGILCSDEVVIRPSVALHKITAQSLNLLIDDPEGTHLSADFKIDSTGRKNFPRDVPCRTQTQLIVRGCLPKINAFFPSVIPNSSSFPRSVSVSIISHESEVDDRVIWLITANALDYDQNHLPTKDDVCKILDGILTFIPDIRWKNMEWRYYRVRLPEIDKINVSLCERGILLGKDPNSLHAYVERLTLAPLLARLIAQREPEKAGDTSLDELPKILDAMPKLGAGNERWASSTENVENLESGRFFDFGTFLSLFRG